jgi:hypothetical protein
MSLATLCTIHAPGIYDMPATVYHQDPCPEPSLSSSIAKLLCLSSPVHAWHAHPRLNPTAVHDDAEHFDIGTAAHALLLEGVSNIAVVDAKDWRTNAAKDARDAARAAGRTPLLAKVWGDVQAMVGALREQLDLHRDGGAGMFQLGEPERTLVWREGDTWCRARLDWLRPAAGPRGEWAIDDYKTTPNANPDTWTRSLFSNGFDLQVAWYLRGLKVLTGYEGTFRFAVQETTAPYAASVVALGPDALTLAEKKRLYALEVWGECRARREWIGYPQRTCYAALPAWEESRWLEKELR